MSETILILNSGSPYNEIVARMVRNLNVYAEIIPANSTADKINAFNPIGIIYVGQPCQPFGNTPVINIETEDEAQQKLQTFLYDTCGAKGDYNLQHYIDTQIRIIRERVGNKRVLLGLSGGVDSSVCAALLSKAIPGQLVCVLVDHGFMRLNECDEIEEIFSSHDLNLIRVDASERFISKLNDEITATSGGKLDSEARRKIVGAEFIRVFEDEGAKLGKLEFFAQGTIYADIIESGVAHAKTIKSHHNVGGLPQNIDFEGVIEPLSGLFKNEVKEVGRLLGLPSALLDRQPFPGPGLAVRLIGEITREKLETLRKADAIVREELLKLPTPPRQYFAVLTDTLSVGSKNGNRTYDYVVAIRAVDTEDFMTVTYTPLPHKVLNTLATRLCAEIDEVSRVVYDISSKPPGTIEWL